MLKIMENEEEIFRKWLYKYVKKDKKITGRKLARQIGIKDPTLTAYHSGRLVDGERKFTAIPFEIRKKILEVTGVSYKEMMKTGRRELSPKIPEADLKSIIKAEIAAAIPPTTARSGGDLVNKKIEKHQKLVGGFEHQDIAIEINQALLQLERTAGKEALLEAKGAIKQILREAEKKRGAGSTANGTKGS